jgi:hypothetical protein
VRLPAQRAAEEFLEQTPWANPAHPSHANAVMPRFHAQTALASSPLASPRDPPTTTRGKSPAPPARQIISAAHAGDAPTEPVVLPVMRRAPNSTERIQTTHASSLAPAPPVERPRGPSGGSGSGGDAHRRALDELGEQMRLENRSKEQQKYAELKRMGLNPHVDWKATALSEVSDTERPRIVRMFEGPADQRPLYEVPNGGPHIKITDWMDFAWAKGLIYSANPDGPASLYQTEREGLMTEREGLMTVSWPMHPDVTADDLARQGWVHRSMESGERMMVPGAEATGSVKIQ